MPNVYYPGETRTFRTEETVTLVGCDGAWVDNTGTGSPSKNGGFVGSGFYRPFWIAGSNVVHYNSGVQWVNVPRGHSITLNTWNASGPILSVAYQINNYSNVPAYYNAQQYASVVFNGETLVDWDYWEIDRLPDLAPKEVPPADISVTVVSYFTARKRITEPYDATIRPFSPTDGTLGIDWELTSDVTFEITVSGTTYTRVVSKLSVFGQDPAYINNQVSLMCHIETDSIYSVRTVGIDYTGLSGVSPKEDQPWDPTATFARLDAAIWQSTRQYDRWRKRRNEGIFEPETSTEGEDLTTPVLFTHTFLDTDTSTDDAVDEEFWAWMDWNATVEGRAKVWDTSVSNVSCRFTGNHALDGTLITEDRNVTGTNALTDVKAGDHTINTSTEYGSGDVANSSVYVYGAEWNGPLISRALSQVVETFEIIGGTNGWAGTDTTTAPVHDGTKLSVTGAGSGTPTLTKTLKNDFNDLDALTDTGRAAWWQAQTGLRTAAENTWWDVTGDQAALGVNHVGDWWRIGKKMTAASDYWNWSSWRYLDVTAWADVACSATLTITYDDVYFYKFGNAHRHDISISRTEKTAVFTLSLTAAEKAHELDMASRGGHYGFRYIRSLTLTFPTGRTVHLKTITAKGKNTPKIDVLKNRTDMANLAVLGDGKDSLFLSLRHVGRPSSVWGWPTHAEFGVDTGAILGASGAYVTHSLPEVAAEIGLQEGYTATAPATPTNGTVNFATYLQEAIEQPLPYQTKARRSFGAITLPPDYNATVEFEAQMANVIRLLTFNPTTLRPSSVPIAAWAGGVQRVAGSSSGGVGRLILKKPETVTIYANKGESSESSATGAAYERSWWPLVLTGIGAFIGGVPLDVDRLGNRHIAYVDGDILNYGRQLGISSVWEVFPAGSGERPWLHVDETHPNGRIFIVYDTADTIYLAHNDATGNGSWTVATVATGSCPFIRIDKPNGLLYLLYWRDVSGTGKLFLKRSDTLGATWLETEIEVASGVEEQTASLDFLRNGNRTVYVVYSDGGSVITLKNERNGIAGHWVSA